MNKPLPIESLSKKKDITNNSSELIKTLSSSRSAEAASVMKTLNSKERIILRPDGKIDFPQLGIQGAQRLISTELSDPKKGIVHGDFEDKDGNKGIPGITYMSGQQAIKEANKQNLKLFNSYEAEEKTKALLQTLGVNKQERALALQKLFGIDFSGFFFPPVDNEWFKVGSVSYMGLSEVDQNGNVSTLVWDEITADWLLSGQACPQPFLAFEEC